MKRRGFAVARPLVLMFAIVLAFGLGVAIAARSTSPRSTATPGAGSTIGPVGAASIQPPTSLGPAPSPTTPDEAMPLVIDPALRSLVPEKVAGSPVTEDADEAAKALSDPTLRRIASAADAAVAVDTASGNLVLAWIVRLRPKAFGDEAYRQWRDSYDEGACTAAGGVVGRAEAQIGGRRTFVTSCGAGIHTYHVWLQDQDVLISASSVGAGRFGEHLLEGLRVPA